MAASDTLVLPLRVFGSPAGWEARALCRDVPALFTVDVHIEAHGDRLEREDAAKRVCASCPVHVECREYALRVQEPLGVWGGLDERERRALLRSR